VRVHCEMEEVEEEDASSVHENTRERPGARPGACVTMQCDTDEVEEEAASVYGYTVR